MLFVISCLQVVACVAPREIKLMESKNRTLQAQIDSLRVETKRLRFAMGKSKKAGSQSQELIVRVRADTELRLQNFEEKIQRLQDRLEDLGNRTLNLPQKWQVVSQAAESNKKNNSIGIAIASKDSSLTASIPRDIQELYNTAYQDLAKGQYKLAREGLSEFLRKYPNSSLADNAQYWLGESFYAEKKFAQAVEAFSLVIKKYPQGEKGPAARLKHGFALISLKRNTEAIRILESLVEKYPHLLEADLARSKLKEIK